MKLLLLEDVPSLGYFGDVVNVKDGYGRNYLLPQRVAVVPTEKMLKEIEAERAERAEERRMHRDALVRSCEKVADVEVYIESNANDIGRLYGSVAEVDIAKALQAAGHEVQVKHIAMGPHITQLGKYEISLRFAPDLKAKIKVNVVMPGATPINAEPEVQPEAIAEGNE